LVPNRLVAPTPGRLVRTRGGFTPAKHTAFRQLRDSGENRKSLQIARVGALATAAERVLRGATLSVLLMRQFGYDARDSVACFAEGSLGGS
jgi:hypothetical protein